MASELVVKFSTMIALMVYSYEIDNIFLAIKDGPISPERRKYAMFMPRQK
jgi:hypothetical protein